MVYVAISIHAPVKGATEGGLGDVFDDLIISIHAPVKGATHGEVQI